ncbi:ribosome-binding factor A [Tepidiforma thermophila]|jgi:ribosome-binding factor A|uniref:Ribosome-binding factor A n=2 Tax=Tepidiforma thermophila (strain KCTC 52669 / CGMCC 1.13589 / G233) TaxID=2761530 RepID=A0A2A9HJF9_TEPT2|nr:ribosome-binding factor A [Tepidiforma thermophila]
MSMRTTRVGELLRAEISELLLREVKDPRVSRGMVTITEVQVSPDLRRAVVYVSHLGSEQERAEALAGLQHSATFLHRELVHRLSLRHVPELVFRFDPSIERGARLAELIHQVSAERRGEEAGD